MVDFIIGGIILVLVAAAIVYIVKQKKAGAKCIGCPEAGRCHSCTKMLTNDGKDIDIP